MGFIDEVRQSNMQYFYDCFQHPFLLDVRKHRLDEGVFLHYLVEDTKYVRDFARVIGMAIYKSESMKEIQLLFTMLQFVEANEYTMRGRMLKKAGYCMDEIEQQPQEKATQAYTHFLLDIAQGKSTTRTIIVSLLPCLLSYAWLAEQMCKENPWLLKESPYREWIEECACSSYQQKCKEWVTIMNTACADISKEESTMLRALYRQACLYEIRFWDMCYDKKG